MSQRKFQFYIVPTPIGNISDITLRAIEVLKEVDFIACEDTRTTQKLLNHYDIRTKCVSYHKYNERERVDFFLNELRNGKTIALVSDAGTPMICDPGNVIVDELRKENFEVTALPGASAVTTFLSQVPRGGEEFAFVGFIPRSEKQIKELAQKYAGINTVFYDSPERILKTLDYIKEIRPVAIGTADEIINHFQEGIRGEIVCMIYAEENAELVDLEIKIKELKDKGFKAKEIATIISTLFGLNKNEVYQTVINQ